MPQSSSYPLGVMVPQGFSRKPVLLCEKFNSSIRNIDIILLTITLKDARRQAYSTHVQKPNQPNQKGSKTIKSTNDDKKPHHERDLKDKKKYHHGSKEARTDIKNEAEEIKENETVAEENIIPVPIQMKSVEQYFKN